MYNQKPLLAIFQEGNWLQEQGKQAQKGDIWKCNEKSSIKAVLQKYNSEPNLEEYFSSLGIEISQPYTMLELTNKNMSRLERQYLPKVFLLFENILKNYKTLHVELLDHKDSSQWKLQALMNGKPKIKVIDEKTRDILTVGQTIVFTKLNYNEFYQSFCRYSQIITLFDNQCEERIDKSANIFCQFYNSFKFQGLDFILWPAVVLQPVIGQLTDLKNIIQNRLDIYNDKYQLFQVQKIFNTWKQIKKSQPVQSKTMPLDFIEKIRTVFAKQSNSREMVINLIGLNKIIIDRQICVAWNCFTLEEQSILILSTPLKSIADLINSIILKFNDFKMLQNGCFSDSSLFKIASYRGEQQQQKACLPLRLIEQDNKCKVLIRILSTKSQKQEKLIWVESTSITVNNTLPCHNQQQRKFYYLLGQFLSIQQTLKLIYSEFYYKEKANYRDVLKRIYPHKQIQIRQRKWLRCTHCNYKFDNQYVSCLYCIKPMHQECARQINMLNHKQAIIYAKNIYEAQDQKEVWVCNDCIPCNFCYSILPKQHLTCIKCYNKFHKQCCQTNFEGLALIWNFPFVCGKCLRCQLCLSTLKHDFCTNKSQIVCFNCIVKLQNKQFCLICKKQQFNNESMVRCFDGQCGQFSHRKCDSLFNKVREIADKQEKFYRCRDCRHQSKRRILRWILEELALFDQLSYFKEPYFEQIEGYADIIKNPMSLLNIRQKIAMGYYDQNSYERVLKDISLIFENAMNFNMPREQPHIRAKIMKVLCFKFLSAQKKLLQCQNGLQTTQNLKAEFVQLRETFYNDLHLNYGYYLLNEGESSIKVEFYNKSPQKYQPQVFSSRLILLNQMANSKMRLRIKIKYETIKQGLLQCPRTVPGIVDSIIKSNCYYHPFDNFPIIFQCPICWQTYCCTKTCFRHIKCPICKIEGCSCKKGSCGCPQITQKQHAKLLQEIQPTLDTLKISKLEYTEYHKYCLSCAIRSQKQRLCYICSDLCYYGYEKCNQCEVRYHLRCQKNEKIEQIGRYYKNYQPSVNYVAKFVKKCWKCIYSSKANIKRYQQHLQTEILNNSHKIQLIKQYLPVFQYFYEKNNIRITHAEIINLINSRYDNFTSLIYFLEKYVEQDCIEKIKIELQQLIPQANSQEQFIEVDQLARYFTQMIAQAQSCTYMIEDHLSQSHVMLQLGKQLRMMQITSKWIPITKNFFFVGPINFQQTCIILPQKYLDLRNTSLIKESVINSMFLQPQLWEKAKKQYSSHALYLQYKTQKVTHRHQQEQGNFYVQTNQDKQLFNKITKQYQQYLRISLQTRHQERLLAYRQNLPLLQIKEQQFVILRLNRSESMVLNKRKQSILTNYLQRVILRWFQENKKSLKRGNTCVVEQSQKFWAVLKQKQQTSYYIRLFSHHQSEEQVWSLEVNENKYTVNSIADIIERLKSYCSYVDSTDHLIKFMGFQLVQVDNFKPQHFTNLLQKRNLNSLTRRQRKRQVLSLYDKFDWKEQGLIIQKENGRSYTVQKQELFYLKKRKPQTKIIPKTIKHKPYLGLEDIKKELFPNLFIKYSYLQQQPQISLNPLGKVYVAPSQIDRLGLFINCDALAGTTIIEYIGQIITETVADERQKLSNQGCYFFGLGKDKYNQNQIIDATYYGNMARYLNHSCEPNCKAKTVETNGTKMILIYTIKFVKRYEQLTYDYQFKIESNERLQCKCQAKNCQGRLT